MSDTSAADFLRDQLEALLASPALARHAEPRDEARIRDPDTEPSLDAEVLRRALRAGLNK